MEKVCLCDIGPFLSHFRNGSPSGVSAPSKPNLKKGKNYRPQNKKIISLGREVFRIVYAKVIVMLGGSNGLSIVNCNVGWIQWLAQHSVYQK